MRTTEVSSGVLRLAIQKVPSGHNSAQARLGGPTIELMQHADLDFDFPGGVMECPVRDSKGNEYPMVVHGRHNKDLVRFGAENSADAVIVGADRYFDMVPRYARFMRLIIPLNIAICTYQLGAFEESKFAHLTDSTGEPRLATLKDIGDERVATAHPNTLKLVAQAQRVNSLNIYPVEGGVEGSYYKGEKFAVIADITSSGGTMRANRYTLQRVLFESSGVLIARRDLSLGKTAILEDLRNRLILAQGLEATKIANNRAEEWHPLIEALNNPTPLMLRFLRGMMPRSRAAVLTIGSVVAAIAAMPLSTRTRK